MSKSEKVTINEQGLGKQKMGYDIAFQLLKIVVGREERNRKGFPQVKMIENKLLEYKRSS